MPHVLGHEVCIARTVLEPITLNVLQLIGVLAYLADRVTRKNTFLLELTQMIVENGSIPFQHCRFLTVLVTELL